MKQSALRVAAAVTAVVFMGVGATGPVYATDDTSDDQTTSGKRYGHEKQAERDGETDGSESDETETTDPDHTDGTAATEGDVDGEQPESTADENDGGANSYDCEEGPEGPYCGTERTEDSANGSGDGEATGRPGAGTVGKADNKNPKGQEPGPSDANNGYECDGNQGIAKGNPAHTGCTDGEPAEVTCPEDATMNDEGQCVVEAEEDGTCPVDATMDEDGECVVPAIPVEGEAAGVEQQDAVLGTELERQAVNRAPAEVATMSGILPATGAGQYTLALVGGAVLLTAGGALLVRRRLQSNR
jgi:LPXTG-motif cell wall-anchored protein